MDKNLNATPTILIAPTELNKEIILTNFINPILDSINQENLKSQLNSVQYLANGNMVTIILTFSYTLGDYESREQATTQIKSKLYPILEDLADDTFESQQTMASNNAIIYMATCLI